jgi:hypothetical protein
MFFEKSLFMKTANSIPIGRFSKGPVMTKFFKKLSFLTGERVEGFFS